MQILKKDSQENLQWEHEFTPDKIVYKATWKILKNYHKFFKEIFKIVFIKNKITFK